MRRGNRRRLKASRTDEIDRRGALGKHRIDQQAHAIELEVDAGMTEPDGAQARRRRSILAIERDGTSGSGAGGWRI